MLKNWIANLKNTLISRRSKSTRISSIGAAHRVRRRSESRLGTSLFESLEVRVLLATFTVDALGDVSDGDFSAGNTTLREAIEQTNNLAGIEDITFNDDFAIADIVLSLGILTIIEGLSILGGSASSGFASN